jgi:glycosyltransferase involved in cell wall biosynthesis
VAKDQFNSLVRAATPNEFAAAIDLLLQDPALGRRLGRNAAEFVQGAYSKQLWDQRISKFFTYDPGFRDGKM